jgi:transposase
MATSPTAVPQGKNTTGTGDLYVSFELADKSWKLTIGDGRRGPSRYSIDAGDVVAVLDCFNKARARCGLAGGCKVHSCYEAGRDGWWLHRWLHEQGVDNIVVDAASIEVNRRARRAKTDRLDGDKLLAMLLRHLSGERVWSVLREPSREAEDERRTHRELARLTHERVAHATRIQALLVLHNLRPKIVIGGRDWAKWWDLHGSQVPPILRIEIERESARRLVKDQVRALESARRVAVEEGKEPLVAQLIRLRAIAEKGSRNCSVGASSATDARCQAAWAWRRRRTPVATAIMSRASAKAGKRRVRALLVELSWGWLTLQPDSALTLWFNKRFAGGGQRMRRVGIVALARRLVIARWKYLKTGEIPAGAVLKPVAG